MMDYFHNGALSVDKDDEWDTSANCKVCGQKLSDAFCVFDSYSLNIDPGRKALRTFR